MIDIRSLKFDGRQRNHQNGLTFYFTKKVQMISFLIDTVGDKKKKTKVTMHPDINHDRAHVHINEHGASFAVDTGELLAGECDNKTRKLIENWIERHRDDLQQLWDIVKRGEAHQTVVQRIRLNRAFREFDFRGDEPQHKTIVDGVVIWYNDEIIVERNSDGRVLVVGVGDIYVVFPSGYPEGHIVFEPLDGNLIIQRLELMN